MKRAVLVALLCLVYATTSLAQVNQAGFEFNGQLYPSFDAVISAAQATSRTVANVPLMCGPRMTPAVLERGHYDLRLDTMVCFTSEEESDRLYAANRRLEASYRSGARPRIVRDVVTNSHHHVCDETPRGTPFRRFAYNGAYDDVCPSHPVAHIFNFVESYYQVGSGKTYLYFAQSDYFWWLDSSTVWVTAMVSGWVIDYYVWTSTG